MKDGDFVLRGLYICDNMVSNREGNMAKAKKKIIKSEVPFGLKIVSILAVLVFLVVGVNGMIAVTKAARNDIFTSFNYELRTAVEVMQRNIDTLHSKYEKGELSYEQARELGVELVRSASWNDGRRGFWALEYDGTLLAKVDNGDVEQNIGENIIEWVDADGKFVEREFIDAAQNGGGYVSFRVDNDGDKNSYIGYALPTQFNFMVDATYDMKYFDVHWGEYTTQAVVGSTVAIVTSVAVVAIVSVAVVAFRGRKA